MRIQVITLEEAAALAEAALQVISNSDMEQSGLAGHALRNMKYVLEDIAENHAENQA